MNPIYTPKGAAREYGELALNIYSGCPHRCPYCFAPLVLHRDRETFHSTVEPKHRIVERVREQVERSGMSGQTVHLCFTCDPYPFGCDSTPTREIIRILKESGNHVQILTKGDGRRDFDLLDGEDWYGITFDGNYIPPYGYYPEGRFANLRMAHQMGIKTWVSFEPVLYADGVLSAIENLKTFYYADKIKIGKLNYFQPPKPIDWAAFGREAESLCQRLGLDYYIKDSLRREMEKVDAT